jgi:hypothetical protein
VLFLIATGFSLPFDTNHGELNTNSGEDSGEELSGTPTAAKKYLFF